METFPNVTEIMEDNITRLMENFANISGLNERRYTHTYAWQNRNTELKLDLNRNPWELTRNRETWAWS